MKVSRTAIAIGVVLAGLFASAAMSQVNNKVCFHNISCGDRLAPCRCPQFTPTCRVCTGTTVGNFCFDCPGQNCVAFALSFCGREYKGVCLAPCFGCPRVCAAQTLVGTCGAEHCN
jgi:hypothetical protein